MTPQILCTLFYSENFFTSTCKNYDETQNRDQKVDIVEQSVDFFTAELLIPHVKKSREYIKRLENGNQNPTEVAASQSGPSPSQE